MRQERKGRVQNSRIVLAQTAEDAPQHHPHPPLLQLTKHRNDITTSSPRLNGQSGLGSGWTGAFKYAESYCRPVCNTDRALCTAHSHNRIGVACHSDINSAVLLCVRLYARQNASGWFKSSCARTITSMIRRNFHPAPLTVPTLLYKGICLCPRHRPGLANPGCGPRRSRPYGEMLLAGSRRRGRS